MATKSSQNLRVAYDVGHDSIGWSVLSAPGSEPDFLGCGSVLFPPDDCLAKSRRDFRRQRRHVRATRQRISRLRRVLLHLGVMDEARLASVSSSSPFALAARVLRGLQTLSWPELWDVIRWYAHNRGYDGNRLWSAPDTSDPVEAEARRDDDAGDQVKVLHAIELLEKHGSRTMAETVCAVLKIDPASGPRSSTVYFKGENAAFPRSTVTAEVRRILQAHIGVLPGVDAALVSCLMDDWAALAVPDILLPLRFSGGLLFGQLVPRFDNRIIALCPISGKKVPAKDCVEFYRFRWAMMLANIRVEPARGKPLVALKKEHRVTLDAAIQKAGRFTTGEFKKLLRSLTGGARDNLDNLLLHPDADKAFEFDAAQSVIADAPLAHVWDHLTPQIQKRTRGQLHHGKKLSLRTIVGDSAPALAALRAHVAAALAKKKPKKGELPPTAEQELEAFLAKEIAIKAPPRGRAAYDRELLQRAYEQVIAGGPHPKEEGGVLFETPEMRAAQRDRALAEKTNNHLVRHRLLFLGRLHGDIIKEFAGGDATRIQRIAIEVNRDLKEFAGKTNKEISTDFNKRLGHFKGIEKKLATDLPGVAITPGLIRKARIADDLGWKCPYTSAEICCADLVSGGRMDKDHIIPRSVRPSDSLDSLIITFKAVNTEKRDRTALQFIMDMEGKPVPGLPNLTFRTLAQYTAAVKGLESWKGHPDDQRRKKNRKKLLELKTCVEKDFTPGDLTRTSQLVRLGSQLLEGLHNQPGVASPPVITSIPGSVTGLLRKSWKLIGCLAQANPNVLDADGHVLPKGDIRGITHLHHALDACVLALADLWLPRDGGVWELLLKRRHSEPERAKLRASLGSHITFGTDGKWELAAVPSAVSEQIALRLAEKRVVQHVPADLRGLACKQTVWRVYDPTDPHKNARRLGRWLAEAKVKMPAPDAPTVVLTRRKRRGAADDEGDGGKTFHQGPTWTWVYDIKDRDALIGPAPTGDPAAAKLKSLKAAKILGDNFALALPPQGDPVLIRPRFIWRQLQELKARNGGVMPVLLRKGSLIQVSQKGKLSDYRGMWRVRGLKFNQKAGSLVDLAPPDYAAYREVKGGLQNVKLSTLRQAGLTLLPSSLCGRSALR